MYAIAKDEHKIMAIVGIDKMPDHELQKLLESWKNRGFSCKYWVKTEVKPYNWPSFDEGEEVER